MGVFDTLFLLFASQAFAAPVDSQEGTTNTVAQNGVLQLSLVPLPRAKDLNNPDIMKRQVSTGIDNFQYGGRNPISSVGIVLEVGTPPQKVILEPDTGSSKFWVLGLNPGVDDVSTSFDEKHSSSLHDLKQEDGARYGSSELVTMNMVTDEISCAGQSLGRMKFGVGNLTHPFTNLGRNVGIMGLLPDAKTDDFILDKLRDQNLVKTRAFSISLRKRGQGALSFGGYDTSKFSGPLEKLAIQPSNKKHYIIQVQSVLFSNGASHSIVVLDKQDVSDRPLTMGIDSGAPALQVDTLLAKTLAKKTGGTFKGQFLEFGCDVVDAKASIDFKISDNTTISIPLLDFVLSRPDNGKTCQLAVQHGRVPADLWTGGHFLRRSMVVYDPDNSSMYVARGADCGSSPVAISGQMPNDVVIGQCKEEAPDFDAPEDEAPNATYELEDIDIRDAGLRMDAEETK